MTEWKAKRFWEKVDVSEADGGFEILLDGRPVRTPGKSPLLLPSRALAERLASEWDAQSDVIDPLSMPATRMANSAIEKVAPQMEAVADHLLAYGGTDLLCYRAEEPKGLADRQSEVWDRWLDWVETALGVRLCVTAGVLPVQQPEAALTRLRVEIGRLTAFELAAFHDLVTLPGSLILGFAAERQAAPVDEIWNTSRVDELWQIAQWGQDDEAEKAAIRGLNDLREASEFLVLVRDI